MPTRYRGRDGSLLIDDRPTLEEWSKKAAGRFGHVLNFEVRNNPATLTEELWALLRTENEWEPQWLPVDPAIVLTAPQLSEIRKNKTVTFPTKKELARIARAQSKFYLTRM